MIGCVLIYKTIYRGFLMLVFDIYRTYFVSPRLQLLLTNGVPVRLFTLRTVRACTHLRVFLHRRLKKTSCCNLVYSSSYLYYPSVYAVDFFGLLLLS